MCGIAGFFPQAGRYSVERSSDIASAMANAIAHRGPDDSGAWVDPEVGLSLGHRRLSIIDLSEHGHQPMRSSSGRWVIAYNGEVYNFAAIRKQLQREGAQFHGSSDTEVLLEAFERWGVEATIEQAVGMFAIALWDRKERVLCLIRDRVGIKPLYYGWIEDSFVFASELKSFLKFPGFERRVDRDALASYFRQGFIPSPHSIYSGVKQLQPGHTLVVRSFRDREIEPTPYWTVAEAATRGRRNPFGGDETQAVEELEALLLQAVGDRMISDVPIGAFLSGGVDSSSVTAAMQSLSQRPVKTFSIGFADARYDEARNAAAVAEHLGTDHTELVVTERDALDVVPALPQIFDEPFADASQIPTYLLCKLTRQSVTVSLSGDGGDELFAGYNRHLFAKRLEILSNRVPERLRIPLANVLTSIPSRRWDDLLGESAWWMPKHFRQRLAGEKVNKVAESLRNGDPQDLYRGVSSLWPDPNQLVINGVEHSSPWGSGIGDSSNGDITSAFMLRDQEHYLPDDILTKVDRTSMGVSLEARVPLLDHRLVEFAWSVPLSMKLRQNVGKWLLRKALYNYVPETLVDRPKAGFAVPINAWLRGDLRDWAEDHLTRARIEEHGYVCADAVRSRWEEHLSGAKDWHNSLWSVLMFQAWLEEYGV